MNGFVNQRYCVATYLESDGGHCDSEFFNKRQEAIDYAKRLLRKNIEAHGERLYAEISNCMNHKAEVIRVNPSDL